MAVLKATKDPWGPSFQEFAISISFDSDGPSASDKVLGLEGPNVDQVEDIIVEPTLDLSEGREYLPSP